MDVYAHAVVGMHRENATASPAMAAKVAVSRMREAFLPQGGSDSEGSDKDDDPICCCLYKSHTEFILFHLFTCCAHLGKRGPAYRALSNDYDASDDELGMVRDGRDWRGGLGSGSVWMWVPCGTAASCGGR